MPQFIPFSTHGQRPPSDVPKEKPWLARVYFNNGAYCLGYYYSRYLAYQAEEKFKEELRIMDREDSINATR